MLEQASDMPQVRLHVDGVLRALGDPRLARSLNRAGTQVPGTGTAQEKITALLSPDLDDAPSSGGGRPGVPFLSRAPLVSLVQSQVEEALGDEGLGDPAEPTSAWSRLVHAVERDFHLDAGSFTPRDPDWYLVIAGGVLEHLARGNHPFNPLPAECDVTDDARLVVVGDWGTGLPRARDVADHMHTEISSALAEGRDVHVIHLGDVYYSGLASEDRRRFLAYWPVTHRQAAAGVTSWSLNGNHDMYSGGYGYFATLLADPRFNAQQSPDRRSTSFFRLRSPSWDFIGLDTAWDSDVVSPGHAGVLEDPQAQYVAAVAADSDRRLVLFSHHQLVSVYDTQDLGPTLRAKLAPVLTRDGVTAWWWGHEHRAITYAPAAGVHYPRCLGNGGVPTLATPAAPVGSSPAITWQSTRTLPSHGQNWTRFGFACLDLHRARIDVRYIDDDGCQTHTETIT